MEKSNPLLAHQETINTPATKKEFDYTEVNALINEVYKKYPETQNNEEESIAFKEILFNILEGPKNIKLRDFEIPTELEKAYEEIISSTKFLKKKLTISKVKRLCKVSG